MTERLVYDVLLEAPGLLRSREIRAQLSDELAEGGHFEIEGRDWVITKVTPTSSGLVDRRVVARPLVAEIAQ